MDEFTVADLRKEEVVKQITTISTFYIPPRSLPHADGDIAQKLGLSAQMVHAIDLYPRSKWGAAESSSPPAYGPFEQEAIKRLANHTLPSGHQPLRASPALSQFLADLALQPGLRKQYEADHASVLEKIPGLSAEEKHALTSHDPLLIYKVMRARWTSGKMPTLDGIAESAHSLTQVDDAAAQAIVVLVDTGPLIPSIHAPLNNTGPLVPSISAPLNHTGPLVPPIHAFQNHTGPLIPLINAPSDDTGPLIPSVHAPLNHTGPLIPSISAPLNHTGPLIPSILSY